MSDQPETARCGTCRDFWPFGDRDEGTCEGVRNHPPRASNDTPIFPDCWRSADVTEA